MVDMRLRERDDRERIARHQRERWAVLRDVAALARVGRQPTQRDYVVYHCYEFVAGKEPMDYAAWMAALSGGTDGLANALSRSVPGEGTS